jgi:hypothetical protein
MSRLQRTESALVMYAAIIDDLDDVVDARELAVDEGLLSAEESEAMALIELKRTLRAHFCEEGVGGQDGGTVDAVDDGPSGGLSSAADDDIAECLMIIDELEDRSDAVEVCEEEGLSTEGDLAALQARLREHYSPSAPPAEAVPPSAHDLAPVESVHEPLPNYKQAQSGPQLVGKPSGGQSPGAPKDDAVALAAAASATLTPDLFNEIDADQSGYITFNEFVRWWKKKDAEHTAAATITNAGTKAASTLSDEALMAAMAAFQSCDIDGSGVIEREELNGLITELELDVQLDLELLPDEQAAAAAADKAGEAAQLAAAEEAAAAADAARARAYEEEERRAQAQRAAEAWAAELAAQAELAAAAEREAQVEAEAAEAAEMARQLQEEMAAAESARAEAEAAARAAAEAAALADAEARARRRVEMRRAAKAVASRKPATPRRKQHKAEVQANHRLKVYSVKPPNTPSVAQWKPDSVPVFARWWRGMCWPPSRQVRLTCASGSDYCHLHPINCLLFAVSSQMARCLLQHAHLCSSRSRAPRSTRQGRRARPRSRRCRCAPPPNAILTLEKRPDAQRHFGARCRSWWTVRSCPTRCSSPSARCP